MRQHTRTHTYQQLHLSNSDLVYVKAHYIDERHDHRGQKFATKRNEDEEEVDPHAQAAVLVDQGCFTDAFGCVCGSIVWCSVVQCSIVQCNAMEIHGCKLQHARWQHIHTHTCDDEHKCKPELVVWGDQVWLFVPHHPRSDAEECEKPPIPLQCGLYSQRGVQTN
jgi:hypothetical protein